jgi:hypothetical protein
MNTLDIACCQNTMTLKTFEGGGWKKGKKKYFLNLSRMGLDILLIPAMAADLERLFSSAGLTVTDCRNHFSIESIEALECIKSWVKL